MQDIYVEDSRPDNEGSLAEVPRLRTFADIEQHFAPLTIDQSQGWDATPVGEACWKVVGFHVTWPQVVIAVKVLNEAGVYIPDKLVYWRYTGAPSQLGGDHRPKYFGDQGLFARTKAEGNGAEFVISGDHWVAPDSAGPDSVWVAAEPGGPQFSDAVHGLGMRVNTDHLIVSPIFRHVVKSQAGAGDTTPVVEPAPGEVDPPVEPPTAATGYELVVVVGGQEVGRIPLQQAQLGDSYLAVFREGQELIGYLPFSAGGTGPNRLVLREIGVEIG